MTKNGAADRSLGYDSNGNMLTDSKIGITASTLGRANLPYAVTKSGTSINYLYSGDDNRIYKAVNTTQKEWYIRTGGGADLGVFDISNNKYTWYVFGAERVAKIDHVPTLTITEAAGNTGGNLYTSDPFVIPLNVGSNLPAPIADYYAYDHLGNTRLVYGALIGCASSVPNYQLRYAGDYYPFGKVLREWTATTSEKYLYTQKERDKETGLDYFGARYYDSELGRFLGVDPLAEKFPNWNSYTFVLDNPISYVDQDGKAPSDPPGTLFVYYMGPGRISDLGGILGHTALGYIGKYDLNNSTLYAPMSGNVRVKTERKGDDGLPYLGVDEIKTIKLYLDLGDLVERYHYELQENVSEAIALILEGIVKNPSSASGSWCTIQCNNAISLAFSESGFSEDQSSKAANKIIYYNLPEQLTKREVLQTGSRKYDSFYKKDDKYYRSTKTYNTVTNEWEDDQTSEF